MPSASEAAALAAPGNSVIGWRLDRAERAALLRRFPPRYSNMIADYVTLRSKVAADAALLHGLMADDQPAGLLHRLDDGVNVERGDGARVDDLDADAFLRQIVGGLEGFEHFGDRGKRHS